jgi:uncharacterized protein
VSHFVSLKVVETPREYQVGLEETRGLSDAEGMYFPYDPPRTASFHMGKVTFPIDIIFLRGQTIAKIVSNIQPGTPGRWGLPHCSGVLEVRGGWCAAHGVRVGSSVEVVTP